MIHFVWHAFLCIIILCMWCVLISLLTTQKDLFISIHIFILGIKGQKPGCHFKSTKNSRIFKAPVILQPYLQHRIGCPLPASCSTVNSEISHSMIDIWNILEFKLVEKKEILINQLQPSFKSWKRVDSDNNRVLCHSWQIVLRTWE